MSRLFDITPEGGIPPSSGSEELLEIYIFVAPKAQKYKRLMSKIKINRIEEK